eukprot:4801087-Amphidinium_carterae.1
MGGVVLALIKSGLWLENFPLARILVGMVRQAVENVNKLIAPKLVGACQLGAVDDLPLLQNACRV